MLLFSRDIKKHLWLSSLVISTRARLGSFPRFSQIFIFSPLSTRGENLFRENFITLQVVIVVVCLCFVVVRLLPSFPSLSRVLATTMSGHKTMTIDNNKLNIFFDQILS